MSNWNSILLVILLEMAWNMLGFPGGANGEEPACQCRRHKTCGFDPWVGKIPWRRTLQSTPVFLPGESHGQRSLVGYSPYDCKEADTTEMILHTHTHTHTQSKEVEIQ